MINNKIHLLLPVLIVPALLLAAGCGPAAGNENTRSAGASLAKAASTVPIRNTHEIDMRGDATGFFFEPKELVIQRGDLVRWKMVDGAPHNVNFTGREFPQGARVLLENRRKLMGLMLQTPGQTYEIHFTDEFPLGEYNYVCDPHAVLNMTGKLIITE
jgi:plastocyanin